jgi:hypothetical protein
MERALLYGSLVAGAFAIFFDLMPPHDLVLVWIALFFASLHFASGGVFLRLVRSHFKWLLLIWSAPILLFTLDNICLLLALYGVTPFRIRIL